MNTYIRGSRPAVVERLLRAEAGGLALVRVVEPVEGSSGAPLPRRFLK